jgi:hypothetical protein
MSTHYWFSRNELVKDKLQNNLKAEDISKFIEVPIWVAFLGLVAVECLRPTHDVLTEYQSKRLPGYSSKS